MTDRTITTDDGVRLHARTDGHGEVPALLLLNSLGTDLSMWELQVPDWAASRTVVRFDQRGHGRSEVPPSPYTVERLGQDALGVLDAYGLETVDLCGLSLGGLVALWVAGNAPERVRRAVFADTAARVGTEDGWRERAETVRVNGMDAVTEVVLSRFFSPTFRASGSPVLGAVERTLRSMVVDGYVGSCEALATADLTGLAPQVRARSLVLVGTADEATPLADARDLHRLLPTSDLIEIADAGHLANLERPHQFSMLVAGFLGDLR